MRRRSERKKSTDVSSPAPASRRTSRRSRKSPSLSKDEKNAETAPVTAEKPPQETPDNVVERASSEERTETRRRRSSRNQTPVKEQRSSPAKRRNNRALSPDAKIKVIPEEENGTVTNLEDGELTAKESKRESLPKNEVQTEKESVDIEEPEPVHCSPDQSGSDKVENNTEVPNNLDTEEQAKYHQNSQTNDEDKEEQKLHEDEQSPPAELQSQSQSQPQSQSQSPNNTPDKEEEKDEENEKEKLNSSTPNNTESSRESSTTEKEAQNVSPVPDEGEKVPHVPEPVVMAEKKTAEPEAHDTEEANETKMPSVDTARVRKRKWITKKSESKEPILAISTDSLKTLIADVHPVPLSDVQLGSSSEVEELGSEREEGEETPSPEPEIRRRDSIEKLEKYDKSLKSSKSQKNHQNDKLTVMAGVGPVPVPVQRSPSPARNQASSVLYITNLVRPFTVLQLKGLLARTGKIVEGGFWIDRIKSKCYVEYETEDEAIETRHALHGVRWPVSNPKCLNVDFGIKADMLRAIETTKDDGPRFGHDNNKDNIVVGTGWSRERSEIEEKKSLKPVREWDVGKKENLDREKDGKDLDKRRERSGERDLSRHRDIEKNERDRDRRQRNRERDPRSSSLSPARKQKKKENDPPLRLLDDLFRKTKATPCIYWLPLTPEQIAEKEAFRQKRIEEHKERIKQRELEREKERNRPNDRERERDHRRNRSSDRRRSRSRDRRRY